MRGRAWQGPGWLLWLALLLMLGTAPAVARAQRLALSPEQEAWIAAHPVVKVALASDFAPYYFYPADAANPWGFLVEALDLISQRTGLGFRYQRCAGASEAVAALDSGAADMLPTGAVLHGMHQYLRLARPLLATRLVVAARRDVPDVSPTNGFGGRRIAVQFGSDAEEMLALREPGSQVLKFARVEEALRAVATGNADLFIGYQHEAVYYIERDLLANVELRTHVGVGDTPLGPVLRADETMLASILDVALASITPADRSRLAARWLPVGVLTRQAAATAELSDSERAWVQAHQGVTVGYDATFGPVTFKGNLGDFHGLGADFLQLAAGKAGLEVVQAVGGSFADIAQRTEDGQIDIFVAMARTPERRARFDFIGPFLSVPTAIVTRLDGDSISDLAEVGLRRVGLLRGHFLIPELRSRYPGIQLVELDRQDQVLSALAEGAVEVAIGNIKVVSELIERRHAGQLLVSGTVRDGDSELYFAVSRGKPELALVLRKGLDAVNEQEAGAVLARWLSIEVRPRLPWRDLTRNFGPVLLALLVGLLLLWRANRHSGRARLIEARGRELAEEAMHSRGRFLAYLSHELRGSLGAITEGARMLRMPMAEAARERLLGAIGTSAQTLRGLLDTTLEYEQNLARPVVLRLDAVALDRWLDDTLAAGRMAAAGKGLTLAVQAEALDRPARIDAARLGQVLLNLVGNAVKFTPAGSVAVDARVLPADAAGAERLRLTVSDSGPGLTDAELATLFDPYVQGDQGRLLGEGAGLGLAITRQLVVAMGGTLTVASAPGSGATFTVEVPLPA